MHSVSASARDNKFEKAVSILEQSIAGGQVRAAAIFVQSGETQLIRSFGDAKTPDTAFLLGSISKPIAMTALMTLYNKGMFDLDDSVQKYLPEFQRGNRDKVTVRHLLTHTSGLPDQLPQNAELRSKHATLADFVKGALKVPLHFQPGTKLQQVRRDPHREVGALCGAYPERPGHGRKQPRRD